MVTHIKEVPTKKLLDSLYYLEGGFVLWKQRHMSRGRLSKRAGQRVYTYADEEGYFRVVIKGESYPLSRIIYQMYHDNLTPEFEVDHIDQDKLNNSFENLRKVPQGINKRNKSKQHNRKDDVTGVCLNRKYHPKPHQDKVTEYYVARWYDLVGVLKVKHFNISKLGYEEAFRLACEYRNRMIAELNEQGAGYTDRHGKNRSTNICAPFPEMNVPWTDEKMKEFDEALSEFEED